MNQRMQNKTHSKSNRDFAEQKQRCVDNVELPRITWENCKPIAQNAYDCLTHAQAFIIYSNFRIFDLCIDMICNLERYRSSVRKRERKNESEFRIFSMLLYVCSHNFEICLLDALMPAHDVHVYAMKTINVDGPQQQPNMIGTIPTIQQYVGCLWWHWPNKCKHTTKRSRAQTKQNSKTQPKTERKYGIQ